MIRAIFYLLFAMLFLLLPGNQAQAITLYDASPGQTPQDQGWSFMPVPPMLVSMSAVSGGTSLQTLSANVAYAGFYRDDAILDRTIGYSLNFDVQVLAEAHDNNNRSGFSVIALSSDLQGIELSFWTNEIFAKTNDIPTFSHAEFIVADTTILRNYQLTIQGSGYSLTGTGLGSPLTGSLRDYSASTIEVYDTPNFLFFGDDTTSAGANILVGSISLQAVPEPGTWTAGAILLLSLGVFKMRRLRLAT